jgi:hypothetical protein
MVEGRGSAMGFWIRRRVVAMRRLLSMAPLLVLALVLAGPSRSAEEAGPLAVGKNLPATFHPYNITARVPLKEEADDDMDDGKIKLKKIDYTTRGKFHCLITEYDLDPVVMLFARGLDENVAFADLLKKLDAAIERNPAVRLRSFVVFIAADVANLVLDDDKREEAVKKFQKVADDNKLKNVVLSVASKADVAKYGLDDASALTAVLYKQLRVEAIHKVSRDKLDKADADAVKAIMKDVAGKLKATR